MVCWSYTAGFWIIIAILAILYLSIGLIQACIEECERYAKDKTYGLKWYIILFWPGPMLYLFGKNLVRDIDNLIDNIQLTIEEKKNSNSKKNNSKDDE